MAFKLFIFYAVLVAFYDKRTSFVGLAPTLKTQKREKGNARRT